MGKIIRRSKRHTQGGRRSVDVRDLKQIGERLRIFLIAENKSNKAVASDLRISQSTVSAWLSIGGENTLPDPRAFLALGRKYNLSLDWLFLGIGEPKTSNVDSTASQ
jgi:transcriptional regulator with XRE-family HTH domain